MRLMVMVVATAILLSGCPNLSELQKAVATEDQEPDIPAADPLIGRWERVDEHSHFSAYTFREDGTAVVQSGTRTWNGTWGYADIDVLRVVTTVEGLGSETFHYFITRKNADRLCWIEDGDPTEKELCYERSG